MCETKCRKCKDRKELIATMEDVIVLLRRVSRRMWMEASEYECCECGGHGSHAHGCRYAEAMETSVMFVKDECGKAMNSEEAKWIAEHEEDVEGMREALVVLRAALYARREGTWWNCSHCGGRCTTESEEHTPSCQYADAMAASERFVKSAVEAEPEAFARAVGNKLDGLHIDGVGTVFINARDVNTIAGMVNQGLKRRGDALRSKNP